MTTGTSEENLVMPEEPLLQVRDLRTYFETEGGTAKAVNGVDFDIRKGEVLGLVGESGSGKTVTALSVLRLVPDPPGKIVTGTVHYKGRNLLQLTWDEIRQVRGKDISMIFQEPMTSLNPVFSIGMQVSEVILAHEACSRAEAFDRSVKMLELVGIPDAKLRMRDYPHHFSGGMRQRVMIAIALACNPSLLIADEPTTALDVTIQAQILELIVQVRAQQAEAAVLLITHNLGVVAETCDRVMVMYGGKIQEVAPVDKIFSGFFVVWSLPTHAAFWIILEGYLFLLVIYKMSKLKEIQEDTTLLIEELVEGSAKKIEHFFESMSDGFEKFFLHWV